MINILTQLTKGTIRENLLKKNETGNFDHIVEKYGE